MSPIIISDSPERPGGSSSRSVGLAAKAVSRMPKLSAEEPVSEEQDPLLPSLPGLVVESSTQDGSRVAHPVSDANHSSSSTPAKITPPARRPSTTGRALHLDSRPLTRGRVNECPREVRVVLPRTEVSSVLTGNSVSKLSTAFGVADSKPQRASRSKMSRASDSGSVVDIPSRKPGPKCATVSASTRASHVSDSRGAVDVPLRKPGPRCATVSVSAPATRSVAGPQSDSHSASSGQSAVQPPVAQVRKPGLKSAAGVVSTSRIKGVVEKPSKLSSSGAGPSTSRQSTSKRSNVDPSLGSACKAGQKSVVKSKSSSQTRNSVGALPASNRPPRGQVSSVHPVPDPRLRVAGVGSGVQDTSVYAGRGVGPLQVML